MALSGVPDSSIRDFLLQSVDGHPRDLIPLVVQRFQVSRQAVHRHLQRLLDEGLLEAEGRTRGRSYRLKPVRLSKRFRISSRLAEDLVWRDVVRPFLGPLSPPVQEICGYGFQEMFNNILDHSRGRRATVTVERTAARIEFRLRDDGVGVFDNIRTALKLASPRDAILELIKGKLTTDPQRHSGEGIFFTARACHRFEIEANRLRLSYDAGHPWLWRVEDISTRPGSLVRLRVDASTNRRLKDVFDQFSSADGDYSFSKTRVPIALARHGDENLISRSQAKRLLARMDKFREVVLDFVDVQSIGQPFADELFRVFQRQHPTTHLKWTGAVPAVENMIRRALNHE